jgi:hypothetical protein
MAAYQNTSNKCPSQNTAMSALRSNASIRETSKVGSALPPETNVGRYRLTTPARIGVMRALNRNVERVFDASRKDRAGGKLKRDQRTGTPTERSDRFVCSALASA